MKTVALLFLAMSTVKVAHTVAPAPKTDRQKVIAVAASQIGTVEKTGRNDGEVDKYLASVGLAGTRSPYCAAFNYWVGREALGPKNPYPKSAWSPDHLKGGTKVSKSTVIRGGETFGIWFSSKGRIAHTGLVESYDGSTFVTIEANTSPQAKFGSAADRDGGGVWRKRRPRLTVHSTRDWINN
jgi:hypothetical protein